MLLEFVQPKLELDEPIVTTHGGPIDSKGPMISKGPMAIHQRFNA